MSLPRKYHPSSIFRKLKKMFKKFDFGQLKLVAKPRIMTIVTFAAIFFLVYVNSFYSNLTPYPSDQENSALAADVGTPATREGLRFGAPSMPLEGRQEQATREELRLGALSMPLEGRQEQATREELRLGALSMPLEGRQEQATREELRLGALSMPLQGRQEQATREELRLGALSMPQEGRQEQSFETVSEGGEGKQKQVVDIDNEAGERKQEQGVDNNESEAVDPLIPPTNITRRERIMWFRRMLPELAILNSDELSQKFHGRILEFLNNDCSVRFYMVWLSPAQQFGPREFLAMDSLFKTNPRACLIILSRYMDSRRGYMILKPLLDRGFKVLAVTPDLPFLVQNTPAEAWLADMKSGMKDPGYIPLSINLSNLFRVTALYKYGGVYLDSDFIVLNNFEGLRNAVGAQTIDRGTGLWTSINGAVMVFDTNHPILLDFIKEFSTTFNGNKWGHNGPHLISRVMERVGDTPEYNITILPPRAFYPVDWIKIRRLFESPTTESDERWVEETLLELTQSYALHLWNKRTRDLIMKDGSVMDRLISEYCVVCQHIQHA